MSDVEREIVADFTVEKPVLQQFVDTLSPLVDECRLHFSEEGFTVHTIDPANVASIVPAKLNPSGFESVDSPGSGTQGVNIIQLGKYINNAKASDLIRIRLDMATRKLLIDYREIHHTMGLIDPDSVRTEPDIPEIDLPNSITVSGSALSEAVGVVDLVTDHIEIAPGEDGDSAMFRGEGDIDDASYELSGESLLDGDFDDVDASTLLSLDYMKDMVKPIPDDSPVRIQFGTDFPIIMSWTAEEGAVDVQQFLAPRIQSD